MARLPTPQSNPALPRKIFTAASEGATEAEEFARVGDRVSQFGQTLQARQAQSEISELNAAFATAQAELTNAWQETLRTADPNDPDTAKNFRDTVVAPRVQALGEIAKTRQGKDFFTRASAGLSAGFLTSTEAGQADLRERAAVENFDTLVNQMSNAVAADPSSFDDVMAMGDIMLDGLVSTSGLSSEQRLQLEGDFGGNIASGAILGVIRQNPQAARELLNAGVFSEHIDGKETQRFLNLADSQERAQLAALEKARERAVKQLSSDVLAASLDRDGSVNAEAFPDLMIEVASNPIYRGSPSEQRAMMSALRAGLDSVNDDDVSNFNYQRDMRAILRGEIRSREEILNRVGSGAYPFIRGKELIDILDGDVTETGQQSTTNKANFLDEVNATLIKDDPITGLNDSEGRARATEFIAQMNRELTARRKAGEPGLEDPTVLQEYRKRLNAFAPTPQELIEQRVRAAQTLSQGFDRDKGQPSAPPATRRKQGETIQEWRKRTGNE